MPRNYCEEHEALAAQFEANWHPVSPSTGYLTPIAWENVDFTPPDPIANWVEFSIVTGESMQASFGAPGQNNFRHHSVISINIYVPAGAGKLAALALADKAAAIFRVQRADGILFRAPTVTTLGEGGGYYRANVSVPFRRDSAL